MYTFDPFGVRQSLMGETPLALASPFGRRPRWLTFDFRFAALGIRFFCLF